LLEQTIKRATVIILSIDLKYILSHVWTQNLMVFFLYLLLDFNAHFYFNSLSQYVFWSLLSFW